MNKRTREMSTISALVVWASAARVLGAWLITGKLTNVVLLAMACAVLVAIVYGAKRVRIHDNPPHIVYLAALHLLIVQLAAHIAPLIFLPIVEPAFYVGIVGAAILLGLVIYRSRISTPVPAVDFLVLCVALVNAYFVFATRPGWI